MSESVLDQVHQLDIEAQQDSSAAVVDTYSIPGCEVFEVPPNLRARCPNHFPIVKGLELGLHHRTLKKSKTEDFKVEIACIVHWKLRATTNNSSWKSFAKDVVEDVNKARRSYSATSSFKDEDVQNLLTLDALFLVVFFMYMNGRSFILEEFKPLAGRLEHVVSKAIDYGDFFLVENQVPMYLLESVIRQLFLINESVDCTFDIESKVTTELDLVINIAILHLYPFKYPDNTQTTSSSNGMLLGSSCCSQQDSQTSRDTLQAHLFTTYPLKPLEKSLTSCHHLLHCLYTVICGHLLPFEVKGIIQSHGPLEIMPSATRLQAIGICAMGSVPTLSGIRLRGRGYCRSANLELPKVQLYDYSESAFHNLALYEQLASAGECGDMRCYLQCMTSLCINESDFHFLNEQGVIINHTGYDSLQGMWARTLKGVYTPYPSSSWIECYQEIHRYRNSRFRRWRQEFWTLFFAKPWTLLSMLAATMLLFLTAAQTWYAAFPHH